MTYTPVSNGLLMDGSQVQQLIDRAQGTRNEAEVYTNNTTATTLTLKNTGGGSPLKVLGQDGSTVVFEVDEGGEITIGSEALVYRPESYGAVGGALFLAGSGTAGTGGAMTLNSAVLTIAESMFTAADVGKAIGVSGAGAATAGATVDLLNTTIVSYQSATQVTLAAPAAASVDGVTVQWGADDTTAFNLCWAAAKITGGAIRLSSKYMVGNVNFTDAAGVVIVGPERSALTTGTTAVPDITRGAFLLIKPGTTGNWIDWCGNTYCGWKNVNIGWGYQGFNSEFPSSIKGVATPAVGIAVLAQSGVASESLWFDKTYVSGSYTTATVYVSGAKIGGADRSQFYNYYEGAKVFALTSGNFANVTSLNVTVNSIGVWAWVETTRWSFHDCEFHEQTNTQTSGNATTYPVYLDGARIVTFDHCDLVSSGYHVFCQDRNTAASEITAHIRFINCNFDSDVGDSGSIDQALGAFRLNAAVRPKWITFENCRIKTSAAWISSSATAGATSGFDYLRVRDTESAGTTTEALNLSTVGSSTRLTNSSIDCAGLTATLNGVTDWFTEWINVGGITVGGSGANNALVRGANGFSNLRINGPSGGIYDENGKLILSTLATASAVNSILVMNNITTGAPEVRAFGSDTNINLGLRPQGTGAVLVQAGGLTVAAGGITATGNFTLTGSLVLTSTTAATASAGAAGAAPAQVSEYLTIAYNGATRKIALYNN